MSSEDDNPKPARRENVRRLAPGVLFTVADAPASHPQLMQLRAESIEQLADYLESDTGSPKGKFKDNPSSRTNEPSERWDLGTGWDGAVEIARNGWREGARKVRAALATIEGDMILTPPQVADVAGGVLDVAAHVAGSPDCFDVDDDEAVGKSRVVRLLVPLSASGMVAAQHLLNRGAAIASVVDALEAGGVSVELEVIVTAGDGKHQATGRHFVKRAGEPLNLDAIATSIVHPATFRRLHFASLEALGNETPGGWKMSERLVHNYGNPAPYSGADLEPPGTFLLPNYDQGDHSTPEKSRETIAGQLQAMGFSVAFEPETNPAK